jgi:hypothetical protein
MSPAKRLFHWSAICLAGSLIACSETGDNPQEPNFGKVVTPRCELGCIPPDEGDPDAPPPGPGIYLGPGVTPNACFGLTAPMNDIDQDGLSDFCEKNLAAAFAPQLAMTKGSDNLGREPKFAIERIPSTLKARVMYLLSYYVDRGAATAWCYNNIVPRSACEGHDGDSEWIALDLWYNSKTQRWLLDYAHLSAHTGVNRHGRGTNLYVPGFIYPGGAGGYPRVYVAYQKHANYRSDAACDDGSIIGTDTCQADLFQRVTAGDNVNIQSRAVHRRDQNCWFSTNPIYSSNGIEECYWAVDKFIGWHVGYPGTGETEYTYKLSRMGF